MFLSKKWRLTKNQRGMTLIELMAVVVILGILATIAGVAVVNASDKAKISADTTTISILKDAAQRYIMDKDITVKTTAAETITATLLIDGLYLRDIPKDSAGNVFSDLTVKLVAASAGPPATPASIEWTFNTAAGGNNFAPRASNR